MIKQNDKEYITELISKNNQKQIEEWTGLKCSDILFDSNVDNWSEETSVFNERIIGKKQLIFLIEDEDNEIFGYYCNTQIIEKYDYYRQETDFGSFQFNLQSKNNRLKQPMKFEIKDLQYSGIELYEKSDSGLICLGNIILCKENKKYQSYCDNNEDDFNYHGIENALCGKTFDDWGNGDMFISKRILVIQMK